MQNRDMEKAVAISGPLWEEGKKLFYDDMGEMKGETIKENATLADVMETLQIASSKASKEYGEHSIRKDKKPLITVQLSRIMGRLQALAQVGDAYMEFAPETVSLVWMSFRLIFTGFLKDSETCATLTDAVDQITEIILLCSILEKRYLEKEEHSQMISPPAAIHKAPIALTIQDRVLSQIPPLYAAILKFSYQSRKLFAHGKLVRSFMSWRSQELQDTLHDARNKRKSLQDTAEIVFQESVLDMFQGLQIETGLIRGVSETIQSEVVPGIKQIQSEQSRTKESIRRAEIEKSYMRQLEWLQSGGIADLALPAQMKHSNIQRIHPGTADWVLSNTNFKSWCDNEASVLWLYGHGGFGKSFLTSSVIEDLERSDRTWPEGKPHIVYFYCRRGAEPTSVGTRIFLHLLYQLYEKAKTGYAGSTPELQDKCSQVIEDSWRRINSDAQRDSSLVNLRSVLKPMFEDLAGAFNTGVFVIVDGLDECIDGLGKDGLLDALTDIPLDSTSNIRVMLSCRPEIYLEKMRPGHFEIEVNPLRTQEPVAKYVKSRVKSMKGLDLKMRKKAYDIIVKRSEGTFRYAHVVLDSLSSPQARKTSFSKLLDDLPNGMEDLYRRAMNSMDPHLRNILIIALRWLMCSTSQISLDLITDELEGRWDILDDTTDIAENSDDDNTSDYADFASDCEGTDSEVGDGPGSNVIGEHAQQGHDIVQELRLAGRDFLKFDDTIVALQHESRFQETIAYEAGPKLGQYIICQIIIRRLKNPRFQKEYITSAQPDHDEPIPPNARKGIDDSSPIAKLLSDTSKDQVMPPEVRVMTWKSDEDSERKDTEVLADWAVRAITSTAYSARSGSPARVSTPSHEGRKASINTQPLGDDMIRGRLPVILYHPYDTFAMSICSRESWMS
ncbi:hypothetical protein GQ43DRAFT_37744 [Delitschia confertaspora ATCC 74209]|uniref:Nephrocystin 3-like N-terminal domain-containing protein n=1 Tax=Delitschia confertaspora ATCC 74209 TaxID=1513339 RepID=A0A9P4JL59_9PLEO|nr:hypothetical protein GQ43DRAFT_37744 [Delitschia confertaspora ATCC 74209]